MHSLCAGKNHFRRFHQVLIAIMLFYLMVALSI